MKRALWVTVVLLLAVAGCGGDDDDGGGQSASEEWVSGLCSAAATWRSSLEDTVSQFGSPSDLTADSLRQAVNDGLDATETFVDDVRGLGRPETEASQEASSIVDSMADDVESTKDDLRDTFGSGDDSLPELISKLSVAGQQIQQMGAELQSSFTELQNLDGGQELKDEIDANADCDAARAGS
jgi:hypothetical protein